MSTGQTTPAMCHLQVKYTHLDFVNLETAGMEHFQGILPQLWGIKVRSPEVRVGDFLVSRPWPPYEPRTPFVEH